MSKDVRIMAYREGHLDLMTLPVEGNRKATDQLLASLVRFSRAYAYTMTVNGKVVCIAGVIEIWKGLGEAWAIVSPDAKDHALAMHRLALPLIKIWFKEMELHRLQATVQSNLPVNLKWAKTLGFQPEATLRSYGPTKEDHQMLVRFSA